MDYLYGQRNLLNELQCIADKFKEGKHFNIMLKGQSGMGKTTLAKTFLGMLGLIPRTWAYIVPSGKEDETFEDLVNDAAVRVVFIDEAHMIKNPEWLYPFMDKRDKTFVLATNESALKEPLSNRCITLILDPYTENELYWMAYDKLDIKLQPEMIRQIVIAGKMNPRVIVHNICARLNYTMKTEPHNIVEFLDILSKLGYEKGLDSQERQYLDILKKNGGMASLSLLEALLHLDRKVIQLNIEPGLVNQGLILLTSKGRKLV